MKGFRSVFWFTLTRRTGAKVFRLVTLGIALLLFLLPVWGLPFLESMEGTSEEDTETVSEEENTAYSSAVSVVYVVNSTVSLPEAVWPSDYFIPGYETALYTMCSDYEEAVSLANEVSTGMILILTEDDSSYGIQVIQPDNSVLSEEDYDAFSDAVFEEGESVIYACMGLDPQEMVPIVSGNPVLTEGKAGHKVVDSAAQEQFADIMAVVLPYFNIMIIYFLVLYYGQGVAQSCVMEKSSKLMDTFLVSVRPKAMLAGKVAANVLAAIAQFAIWMLALVLGLNAGVMRAEAITGSVTSVPVYLVKLALASGGMLDPVRCIVALLLISAGFLLYCSLAAIGGALAGKQEELGTTNYLFIGALIISFLFTLKNGIFSNPDAGAGIMDFVPFTSALVTPARILNGFVTPVQGLIATAVSLLVALAILVLAGRIYVLMTFYRGNVPKPKELFKMIIGK